MYEVIELIKHAMNQEYQKTEIVERALPEFKMQYLNTEKLQRLGWSVKISLKEEIRSCILFYQCHFAHENR